MAENPTKKAIDQAVNWLDGKGAEAFEAALAAGGVLAEDYVRVCAAVDGLLTAGLTREAIVALVELKAPRAQNGSRISSDTIDKVLTGIERMRELLLPHRMEELKERTDPATPELAEVLKALDRLPDAQRKVVAKHLSGRK
jgi:DNA-directed RNA polymerase specialized sigma24 family protein